MEKRNKKREVKVGEEQNMRSLFFRDPSQQGSVHACIMSLTTSINAQTTNPRFMCSNHEIVKRGNAAPV